jgi:hypothetical protein
MFEKTIPKLNPNTENASWKFGSIDRRVEIEKFEMWCKANNKFPMFEYISLNEKKRCNLGDTMTITILISSRCEVRMKVMINFICYSTIKIGYC